MTSAMTRGCDWLNSTSDWDQRWTVWSQSLVSAKDYSKGWNDPMFAVTLFSGIPETHPMTLTAYQKSLGDKKNRCSGKTNLGIHFRERYFHYESNSFKLCAQHDDRNFIDRMLFKQAYSMCVTVASTIFYSLNCCIRIIFTSCYWFFLNFSSRFIYSCVLLSVFYTINERKWKRLRKYS